MSASPSPLHPNQCRCGACLDARKAQYHADMDGAPQHPAIRTTRPDQVGAGLELMLRLLEPLKAKNAELQKRVDDMAAVIWRALHSGEEFAEFADAHQWGSTLTKGDVERCVAWAELENERRATR